MAPAPILIPAFEPDHRLGQLIAELDNLAGAARPPLLLIDDGSRGAAAIALLDELAQRDNITLIRHPANRGKGAALKSGITEAQRTGANYIVTADADGQHSAADILKLHEAAADSDQMWIGTRQFGADVPLRSRFGNRLTRFVFNRIAKFPVQDTQSGLRAIPRRLFDDLLAIRFDRYDFEFAALSEVARQEAVSELPIATLYEPGNPTSHFNPVRDSTRIYFVLARYITVVPLIALAEFLIFAVLARYAEPSAAFITARCISLVIYFVAMRHAIFRSQGRIVRQALLYGLLVAINMVIGSTIIALVTRWADAPLAGYILSGVLLVAFNFLIQRSIIFRQRKAN